MRFGPETRLGREAMTEAAARITVPVELVLQADDEVVPLQDGIALFQALGSAEKTLHVNPDRHVEIPLFERDSWERFYARHLVVPAPV
jgi:alpha-beta hydrolase superfamily lysophospholipase